MSVTLFMLRKQSNLARIEQDNLDLLKIKSKMNHLTNFSSAISDGVVDPNELSSIGSENFDFALQFNFNASDAAKQYAEQVGSQYIADFSGLSQETYYSNPNLCSKYQLFYDPETGTLDEAAIRENLYEAALKEYGEKIVMPDLHQYELELNQEKERLSNEIESLQQDNKAIQEAMSSAIQSQAIKLA